MGDEKMHTCESTEKSHTVFCKPPPPLSVLSYDQRQRLSLLPEGFCCPLCAVTHFPQEVGECSQPGLTVACDWYSLRMQVSGWEGKHSQVLMLHKHQEPQFI